MQVFARRLVSKRYSVRLSQLLSAKSKEGTVHIDPSGLCWSSFDPADAVLPAVPDALACPKDRLPIRELEAKYFKAVKSGGTTIVRLNSRMESSSLWDALRASGECGLAPDEHDVVTFLMEQAGGTCRMVTDFPVEESTLRTCGRKHYFDSRLRSAEAASTLRTIGGRGSRNSYIQRDGTLRLSRAPSRSHKGLVELFDGLDEWCFFTSA